MQHTLRERVEVAGVAVHTGARVALAIGPASAGAGVVFRRADIPGSAPIPARVPWAVDTRLATTLGRGEVRVMTVEHLLAALYGLGVDNAVVDVHGPEVPALDGSARGWVDLVRGAGLAAQEADRGALVVCRPVEVRDGDRVARLLPADRLELFARISFDHPSVGDQSLALCLDNGAFEGELCWARTFGFLRQVDALRRMGLALGGSLDNAVVFGPEGALNEGGLRSPDEPVRHKMLDMLGDLALLGRPVVGRFEAELPGHGLTLALVAEVERRTDAWILGHT